MNNEYNNIEITAEEHEALENLNETTESPADDNVSEPVEESVQTEESVQAEETTEPTPEEPSKEVTETEVADNFEIDGQQYSLDQIKEWRNDSTNKANWQKSNTEKAQELSKWNKLTSKIQTDESFRNHLKDFYYDEPETIKSLGLDGETVPLKEAKEPTEVELRLNALEQVEGARLMEQRVDQLDSTLSHLEKTHPDYLGDQDKVAKFLDFADTNSSKYVENGIPNLERAFKEWSYSQMQEELTHLKKLKENENRNTGVINTSEAGAKDIKSDKKVTNWKDVSMTNPEISKYFDK
jgi:hypothetical protein